MKRKFCNLLILGVMFFLLICLSVPTSASMNTFKVQLWGETADGNVGDMWLDTGIDLGEVSENPDDWYTWTQSGTEDLYDTSHTILLGTFEGIEVELKGDPIVKLKFNVTAGSELTTFIVTSSTLSFGPFTNPDARAAASITVTDGDGDGATLTGAHSGNKCYEARYNSMPHTVWASIVDGKSVGPNLSGGDSGERPASGLETISDTVSSMHSEFKFTLTDNDLGSGTSVYYITPEPATVVLFGLGALMTLRRRRL